MDGCSNSMQVEKMISLDTLPEPCIDTVRFRIPVELLFRDWFFANHCTNKHAIFKKSKGIIDPEVKLSQTWEKALVQYPSSFSNMTMMTSDVVQSCNWAKGVDTNYKRQHLAFSIDVEYSVHKWQNKSSAFNNGELTFAYIWEPVAEAFRFYGVEESQIEILRDHAFLRRLDLSINMQLKPRKSGLSVSQVMANMLRFKFRRSELGNSSGNCSFDGNVLRRGNENSLYKIVIYDKEKEFLSNFKKNRDATDEEIAFYDLYREEVKDILRFEVRYTNRFFSQGLKMGNPQGPDQIQNVIDLSRNNWNTLYKETMGAFALKNATFEQNLALAKLKEQCRDDKKMHLYIFASDCIERGWRVVKETMPRSTYQVSKRILLEKYEWDITNKSAEEVLSFIEAPEVQKEQLKICLIPAPLDHVVSDLENLRAALKSQKENVDSTASAESVYYVN